MYEKNAKIIIIKPNIEPTIDNFNEFMKSNCYNLILYDESFYYFDNHYSEFICIIKINNEYYPLITTNYTIYNNHHPFVQFVKKNNEENVNNFEKDTTEHSELYEESVTNDNYAMFMSEYVDEKSGSSIENEESSHINNKIFNKNDEIHKSEEKTFITTVQNQNINKKQIANTAKIFHSLSQLQSIAVSLNIDIYDGIQKNGKPKPKTKPILFAEIRTFL